MHGFPLVFKNFNFKYMASLTRLIPSGEMQTAGIYSMRAALMNETAKLKCAVSVLGIEDSLVPIKKTHLEKLLRDLCYCKKELAIVQYTYYNGQLNVIKIF